MRISDVGLGRWAMSSQCGQCQDRTLEQVDIKRQHGERMRHSLDRVWLVVPKSDQAATFWTEALMQDRQKAFRSRLSEKLDDVGQPLPLGGIALEQGRYDASGAFSG